MNFGEFRLLAAVTRRLLFANDNDDGYLQPTYGPAVS
jgi:hypothetical protein